MQKPSLTVPSPETYARSALQTLGKTNRTHGYWPHSIQVWIARIAPKWLHMYIALGLNVFFRANAVNKRD